MFGFEKDLLRQHDHRFTATLTQKKDKAANEEAKLSQAEPVPISALNQMLFCPRRCALMHIEGIWADNEHTVMGTLLHDNVDRPGYETARGVTLLRALPLRSDRYGLSGQADIVEIHDGTYAPVEYKKGRRRRFDNDDVQLCAQALCLEEMFACEVPVGYVFHAASKRRREVIFDWKLRAQTIEATDRVRELLSRGQTPPAKLQPRCDGCSLRETCLPEITDPSRQVAMVFDL